MRPPIRCHIWYWEAANTSKCPLLQITAKEEKKKTGIHFPPLVFVFADRSMFPVTLWTVSELHHKTTKGRSTRLSLFSLSLSLSLCLSLSYSLSSLACAPPGISLIGIIFPHPKEWRENIRRRSSTTRTWRQERKEFCLVEIAMQSSL